MFKISAIFIALSVLTGQLLAQSNPILIASPDKQLQVSVWSNSEGSLRYQVKYLNKEVIGSSTLGLTLKDAEFTNGLSFISSSAPRLVKDNYEMVYAKKSKISYLANQRVLNYANANKQRIAIT